MEYVYAAMLIHKAGGKIDEGTVTKVLEASGAKPDAARVKALVAAFDGVDVEKVIKEASVMPVAPAA
jgi:large subunit ribosomal protein L12